MPAAGVEQTAQEAQRRPTSMPEPDSQPRAGSSSSSAADSDGDNAEAALGNVSLHLHGRLLSKQGLMQLNNCVQHR